MQPLGEGPSPALRVGVSPPVASSSVASGVSATTPLRGPSRAGSGSTTVRTAPTRARAQTGCASWGWRRKTPRAGYPRGVCRRNNHPRPGERLRPPCRTSCGSPGSRETGRHRGSPTPRDLRVSAETGTLCGSHDRLPGARIPPWCACLRPGLSSGAFRSLTAASAASTDGWSASGHGPLRAGGSKVEFDVSIDGFPEQGRQMV